MEDTNPSKCEECRLQGVNHVTLARTDILEECIASIIRVTGIGKLGTMLAVTSNQSTL
jgi:hypothetical protein